MSIDSRPHERLPMLARMRGPMLAPREKADEGTWMCINAYF